MLQSKIDKLQRGFVVYVVQSAEELEFPDPKDRTVNQPTIIIQPNVIREMASKVRDRVYRKVIQADNPDIVFEDRLEHFCSNKNCTPSEYDTRLFGVIASWVGWRDIKYSGKQIILTANVTVEKHLQLSSNKSSD